MQHKMTAQQFAAVLKDFGELQALPASALRLLVEAHPYCANLYLLQTYKLHEIGSPDYLKSLEMAALQTLDRGLLADKIKDLSDFLQERVGFAEKNTATVVTGTETADHKEMIGKPLSWHSGSESLLEKMLGESEYFTLDQSLTGMLSSIAGLADFLPPGSTKMPFKPKKKPVVAIRQELPAPTHQETVPVDESDEANHEFHRAAQKSIEEPMSLASETLAKILAKQGQTEKAIEMYKRLILIFPEKKAYFASAIENLKNL